MNSAYITDITKKASNYLDILPPAELVAIEEDAKNPAVLASRFLLLMSLSNLTAIITFLYSQWIVFVGRYTKAFCIVLHLTSSS